MQLHHFDFNSAYSTDKQMKDDKENREKKEREKKQKNVVPITTSPAIRHIPSILVCISRLTCRFSSHQYIIWTYWSSHNSCRHCDLKDCQCTHDVLSVPFCWTDGHSQRKHDCRSMVIYQYCFFFPYFLSICFWMVERLHYLDINGLVMRKSILFSVTSQCSCYFWFCSSSKHFIGE